MNLTKHIYENKYFLDYEDINTPYSKTYQTIILPR